MPSGSPPLVRPRLTRRAAPPRVLPPVKKGRLLVSVEVPVKLRTGPNLRYVAVPTLAPRAPSRPSRPAVRPDVAPRLTSTAILTSTMIFTSTVVLEMLSGALTTFADYRKRVGSFLGSLDRHRLPHSTDRHSDLAMGDWADLEFLSGEGCEAGRSC